ncbi:FMR1-interacting protein NUFIP1 [Drosophila albomicans]|uniref:FMR1-interacting protein NUFIP1 n=1 Tax=Drosophila albomicans TaxID=7291 RepID=A0A6P8X1V4_DROAB|nr:FMR1-interacting protein NUFIP1 [Drosophila albomicans]
MEPKFVLPSPNFNKNSKEPSKNNLHYLTPCGMTLLPRSKQPPPMYGARGSTVPAKYLKPEQPQNTNVNTVTLDAPTKCVSPPRPEFCGNCNMGLANAQDMRRHLEQHEDCPADDCDFAALASILERHIEANHITGLYKTVKRVWTPEDIAAWRAERCKRFPTTANVELAKRAKEQRQKRGERLEASKARFGKPEDRRRTRPESNNKERVKLNKRQKKNVRPVSTQQQQAKQTENKTPPVEQDAAIDAEAARKFRGTGQMKDYKHVKEKSKQETNALSSMLGMYGTDSEDEEEDEITDEEVDDASSETLVEPKEDAQTELPSLNNNVETEIETVVDTTLPQETPQSSDDEAPDEAPIERKKEVEIPLELVTEVEATTAQPSVESTAAVEAKPQLENKTTVKRAAPTKKRVLGLNYKRARLMTKQNTMLSKLLESDIRHERNVLLQCVRYVCEQNFFGLGSSSSSPTRTESTT